MSEHAIIADQAGGPEVLEWKERKDLLRPGPGEILVRTEAVGLNFIETYQRSGVYPVSFPFIPGSEGAGEVVEVGAGVTNLAVGDRVTTSQARGTYAESFLADADRVVRVPDGMSAE